VIIFGRFFTEVLNLEEVFKSFEHSVIDLIVKKPIIQPVTTITSIIFGHRFAGIILFISWFLLIIYSMSLINSGLDKLIELEWEDRIEAAFKNPIRGFFTGFGITWLVGSSSIGSSLMIPFLATRVINLQKAYPYLCGCNMATTVDLSQIYGYIAGGLVGVMLGFAHIFLNIIALIIWLVSPLRFIPVRLSEELGKRIVGNRNVGLSLLIWVIVIFFLIPIMVIYLL
jgi:sodium-dependent phosphate cotransporter